MAERIITQSSEKATCYRSVDTLNKIQFIKHAYQETQANENAEGFLKLRFLIFLSMLK